MVRKEVISSLYANFEENFSGKNFGVENLCITKVIFSANCAALHRFFLSKTRDGLPSPLQLGTRSGLD